MARIGLTTNEDIEKMQEEIYKAENNIVDKKTVTKKKKAVWTYIVLGVLVLLTALFVLKAASVKESGENISIFGYSAYQVQSGSMVPTLNVGDVFVSKAPKSATEIEIGSIITFKNTAGTRITHRVIEFVAEDGKTKYRTQGDANETPDVELVTFDRIEAVWQFTIPSLNFGK